MFSFILRGKEYQAATLAGISAAYSKIRDESGEGATTFPFVMVAVAGEEFGYISYNGRVWAGAHGRHSKPHNSPLYDPYADPVPEMLRCLNNITNLYVEIQGHETAYSREARVAITKAEASRT